MTRYRGRAAAYHTAVLCLLGLAMAAGCTHPPSAVATVAVRQSLNAPQAVGRPGAPQTPQPAAPIEQAAAPAVPEWARRTTVADVPVPRSDRVVALTFDDGPWPVYTRQVLQVLRQHGVRATFFMLGSQVKEYPRIAREVRDAGHVIGNHSWSHPVHPRDAAAEVRKTDAAIHDVLGIQPNLFRPPYGLLTNGMAASAKREGDVILLWSADSRDWSRPGVSRLTANALRGLGPGGIVLMHDGGGVRRQTVAALSIVIERLQAKGYRFVTIPELLAMRVSPAVARRAPRASNPRKAAALPLGLAAAPANP